MSSDTESLFLPLRPADSSSLEVHGVLGIVEEAFALCWLEERTF